MTPELVVVPCYTGPEEEPEELRALRSAPGLVNDTVRRQGFLDQQLVFNPGYGVDRNYWKGHFVTELPDELIDELINRMLALGRPPGAILIESLHGAPKDVDPASAALGYRDAAFNISVMASWLDASQDDERSPGPARRPRRSSPGRSAAATPTTCRPTSRSSASGPPSAPSPSTASRR